MAIRGKALRSAIADAVVPKKRKEVDADASIAEVDKKYDALEAKGAEATAKFQEMKSKVGVAKDPSGRPATMESLKFKEKTEKLNAAKKKVY